jgi:hypothetical protein
LLIERREYLFRQGGLQAFLEAQPMLGFDPETRPTLARAIGYFSTAERLVHYWRYDSYDDWHARLHRKDTGREEYFRKVRPLMESQESSFMLPAPVAALTPYWGNGRDWLPGDAAVADLARHPRLVVEERVLDFAPGGLPGAWVALEKLGAIANLLGCFYTLVGRQHRVTLLRWHPNRATTDFLKPVEALATHSTKHVLEPVRLQGFSPLFA